MVPKLNKRGSIEEPLLAAAGIIFILIITIFILLIVVSGAHNRDSQAITAEKLKNGDTVFLMNYLRRENISDIIVYSYFSGDYDELKAKTEAMLTSMFGEKICYKVYINDQEVKETSDCRWLEDTENGDVKARAYLPYNGGVLKVCFGEKT